LGYLDLSSSQVVGDSLLGVVEGASMADDKISFRWLIGAVVVAVLVALISAGVIVANRNAGNGKANRAGTDTAATPTSVAPTVVPAAKGGAEVRACMAQHQMDRSATTSTTIVEARGTFPGETPETAQPDHVTILTEARQTG
jgi:hypothetical protein